MPHPVSNPILDQDQLKQDGVAHFFVAGFHQIVIYKPGKTDDDVILESGPLFINDTIDQFYLGIEPAGDLPPLCQLDRSFQCTKESVSF
jgi:hypothetical protein